MAKQASRAQAFVTQLLHIYYLFKTTSKSAFILFPLLPFPFGLNGEISQQQLYIIKSQSKQLYPFKKTSIKTNFHKYFYDSQLLFHLKNHQKVLLRFSSKNTQIYQTAPSYIQVIFTGIIKIRFQLFFSIFSNYLEMHIEYLLAACFLVRIAFGQINLVCNGDFELWNPIVPYTDSHYSSYSSDPNCWYEESMRTLQGKIFDDIVTTVGADLSPSSPIKICQTLALQIGKSYTLSYDLFCSFGLKNMLMTAELNGNNISTLYVATEGSFGSTSLNVTISTVENEFCFSEVHQNKLLGLIFVGGLLDNVSLIEIVQNVEVGTNQTVQNISNSSDVINQTNSSSQSETIFQSNQTAINSSSNNSAPILTPNIPMLPIPERIQIPIIINFEIESDEKFGEIILVSNFSGASYFTSALNKERIKIYISGEYQQKIEVYGNQQDYLCIKIVMSRTYDLHDIRAEIKDYQLNEHYFTYQAYFQGNQIRFYALTDEQQALVSELEPFCENLISFSKTFYTTFSQAIGSFIVFSLLAFWNLIIMYNFLLISTVPSFLRKMYEIWIQLLYLNTSFLDFVGNVLGLQKNYYEAYFQKQITENMPDFMEGFYWFGQCGFSTRLFENNMENFALLAVLIAKLVIVSLLVKIIKKIFGYSFESSINYSIIYLMQLISVSPYMIVSSYTSINNSVDKTSDKGQKIGQIFLAFVCVSLIPVWLVIRNRECSKNITKIKKSQQIDKTNVIQYFLQKAGQSKKSRLGQQKKLQKIQAKINKFQQTLLQQSVKQEKAETFYDLFEILLYLMTPILIMLTNVEAFLLINGIIIFYRGKLMVSFFSAMSLKQKVFRLLITLIWMIQHTIFFIFYVCKMLQKEGLIQVEDNEVVKDVYVIGGLLAMLTVICGGLLELIKVFLDFLGYLLAIAKFIFRKTCNKKVGQEQQAKAEHIQQAIRKSQKDTLKKVINNYMESGAITQKARKGFRKKRIYEGVSWRARLRY